METGAVAAVGSEEEFVPVSQLKRVIERAKRLERLIGRLTGELDLLLEAIKIGREKTVIAKALKRCGGLANDYDFESTQCRSM